MRLWILVVAASSMTVGCASDRSITGPPTVPSVATSASKVRPIVRRCDQGGGVLPSPYIVIDGQVYTSASANFPTVDPAQIVRIEVLKGTEAAARFGPEAGTLGVVIVTMQHAPSASIRPAP